MAHYEILTLAISIFWQNTVVLPDWVRRSVHIHWATGVFYDQALTP